MQKRRYPLSLFVVGFLANLLFHYFWLFIPGLLLLIVGIWVDWCLYAGLALLGIDILLSFAEQMKIRQTALSDSDNEQFRHFQEAISKGGNVFDNIRGFVEDAVEEASLHNEFLMELFDAVCEKCQYGENMEQLNEHERVFYIAQILEQEVNNGGFSQFFFNASGDFSNELVDTFTKLGALKTAEICKKALSVFGGTVPTDRDERQELLDRLDCDGVLDECDDAFYNYEDDLEDLNYIYVMAHRSAFD